MPGVQQSHICPKCGYDQTGEIAAWKTQCPVQGTCSECGFVFLWSDIFDAQRSNLPWYIEHINHKHQFITRTPSTLLRLLNPFRFWGALTPLSAIRLRVLMLWVFVLGIAMHVVVTVPGTVGYYSRLQSRQGYWLNQFNSKGVYAYPELAFNRLFEHVFEMRYQGTPSGPGEIKIWFDWGVSFLSIIARPVSLSVGINMMWLAVLLLIPTTRRLAKIRTAHVLRAFLLSMIAAMVVFQAARFNLGMRSYYWRTHITLLGYRPALQILVIWQLVYWPVVIHIGWKIQKSKLLIALGSTAAILFGLLLNITIFILPDLL